MPKRLSTTKRPKDVNQLAHHLINQATEEKQPVTRSEISRIMAAMGSKGGKKSAKARMEKIAPETRRAIALRAAQARWANRPKKKKAS